MDIPFSETEEGIERNLLLLDSIYTNTFGYNILAGQIFKGKNFTMLE
jgi:hypothetical protein